MWSHDRCSFSHSYLLHIIVLSCVGHRFVHSPGDQGEGVVMVASCWWLDMYVYLHDMYGGTLSRSVCVCVCAYVRACVCVLCKVSFTCIVYPPLVASSSFSVFQLGHSETYGCLHQWMISHSIVGVYCLAMPSVSLHSLGSTWWCSECPRNASK